MHKSILIQKSIYKLLMLIALLSLQVACSNGSDILPTTSKPIDTTTSSNSVGGTTGTPTPSPTPLSPVATPTAPIQPVSPTKPIEPSLSDKIKTLEDNGTIPKLDRSADIKGPDKNNNGVRDDIDAWIAALPITEKQKRAATQKAQYFQRTLIMDLKDKLAMQSSFDEMMASGNCLDNVFMPDYQDAFKLASKIEALTANTKNRAYRYLQYSHAGSGTSAMLPDGDTCK